MKPARFDYAAPRRLEEALALLRDNAMSARLLAGGQSLVPAMNLRLATPDLVIDLNRVEGLAGIRRLPDGTIVAGALARHRDFQRSALVAESLPLVHAAIPYIAHSQIRTRGTIGGSLAHADPAAEWPALCLACEATMTLEKAGASRAVPAEQFSLGVYYTALEPEEILTRVSFPAWPAGRRWAFHEMSRRTGDFAVVGVAGHADLDGDGHCRASRVVVFGASDRPVTAPRVSEVLAGRRVDDAVAREAAAAARESIDARSDLHASAAYRSRLVETLVRRALEDMFIGKEAKE